MKEIKFRAWDKKNKMDSDIIFYAFRYALGRMSCAVSSVSSYIEENLEIIHTEDKKMMIKEIREAIIKGHAGDPNIDVPTWKRLSDLLEINISLTK